MQKKYMMIGAHPDDADISFGGTAALLIAAGHKVKFVSVANGCCGHHEEEPASLAERRYKEAQAAAKIAGLEYEILPIPDCEVEANLENRRLIVKLIREFGPDVVITHRPCDYHADHRNTAQLVIDASFLIRVPNYCPDIPVPEKWPVFLHCWDQFKKPYPFTPDIVIAIDSVIEKKLDMIDCHKSQVYEWLPWVHGYKDFDVTTMHDNDKRQWLTDKWLCRNAAQADSYRDLLIEQYGEKGNNIQYVEALELCEYGRIVDQNELNELFSV